MSLSVNAISKLVYACAALALAMLVATPLPAAASAPTSNGKWHVTKFDPNSVPRYKPQPVPPCDPSFRLGKQVCQAVTPSMKSGH
ncbi:MAG: hypothetical protein E6G91_15405 [Alphaproteobacteria bacterium]|nr:MAG: hypothetical protein E6G91_15405 [Alphaproteobacteria bacterium]